MIAPCGLDCSSCDIYKAAADRALAERIAAELSGKGYSIEASQVRCGGCRGEKPAHPAVGWFAGCPILTCCTGTHGLDSCGRCGEFPCAKLTQRAAKGERYREALERLRRCTT